MIPASSRETCLERLRAQNSLSASRLLQARELGEPAPAVQGLTRGRGPAAVARALAKDLEDDMNQMEAIDDEEYYRTRSWTAEQESVWHERRAMVDREWNKAERSD